MLCIQERSSSNTPTVSYTVGSDLSGTLNGAGGIGGLLARSHGYSSGAWSTHNFYHADGNGNITAMVDSTQSLVASYKYDPYGNSFGATGTMATANQFRFSSKRLVSPLGLYYYPYRFYDPSLQRWLTHDPIQETGGINVYRFNENDPQNRYDALGLVPGYNYGMYCGWSRRGPGKPVDDIDAACERHDECLAGPKEFCNPVNQGVCHALLCLDAKNANCAQSPNPKECFKYRGRILALCGVLPLL